MPYHDTDMQYIEIDMPYLDFFVWYVIYYDKTLCIYWCYNVINIVWHLCPEILKRYHDIRMKYPENIIPAFIMPYRDVKQHNLIL